jgi:DNA polymerase III subunit gamma/tau
VLFDGINRKGFEGDLVLNGFAEFIRNLLVCKDEKAAGLLEVVESFRDRYVDKGKSVSAALLISALNILNDAEINYKAARNKRLHVELALIKLCYLQQAIELSSEGGSLSKKKLIESVRPLAFRSISPLAVRDEVSAASHKTTEPRLVIEEKVQPKQFVPQTTIPTQQNIGVPASPVNTAEPRPAGRIAALDKIRKQYQSSGTANAIINEPLQQEELQTAWNEYVLRLRQQKNPAAQPFDLAELRIRDSNSFEAVTGNNIEQKFIEQERNNLFIYLRERLKNNALQFTVSITDKVVERVVTDAPLSSKDQFLKLAEQYPLLRDFKERLKLDLDY